MSDARASIMRVLASARLAAWLIGVQVGFLLLAYLVPQRGIFPEDQVESFLGDVPGPVAWLVKSFRLDSVFTSSLFYIAAGVLAVNLIACTWQRIARRTRRPQSTGHGTVPESATAVTLAAVDDAEAVLRALGARVADVSDTERRYYLRRGGVGFAGSIAMHSALVLILVAGILTGLTTFRGEMLLTEGQMLSDVPEDYLAVTQTPKVGTAFDEFALRLDRMEFSYEDGSVVDAVAHLTVSDVGGSRTGIARVNYPLKAHGKSFLLQDAGHSVWLTVTDAAGEILLDSFVNLASYTTLGYSDSFPVPDGTLQVVSRPDAEDPIEAPVRDGLDLRSPIVGLALGDALSAENLVWVSPGSSPITLDGYLVTVNEVRIWNRFMVRADGGRNLMYVAFGLVILGALARFLDPDRWLRCRIVTGPGGAILSVWGAERYKGSGLPREGQRVLRRLGVIEDSSDADSDVADAGRPASREGVRNDG